ncbi:MAG: sigma-54 dependent transcriptional regulator [Ignavibacteriales bacterium]|nr:sigma-54 dependent transcriptional regulator [Ignavibacteriales bacterium]
MAKLSASILAVDDEDVNLELLKRVLPRQGYYVDTASDGAAAITMLQTLPFDLILLDIMMPIVDGIQVLKFVKEQDLDTEVIILTAVQDVKTAVECMDLGAFYYITKPYHVSDLLGLIERALERKRLVTHNKALKSELARRVLSANIKSQNKTFLEVLDMATRAAPTDSAVLIQGAIGTGKEMVADFLYNNSLRKEQPFLALNCSSMPEELLESELFGQEKGDSTVETGVKQGLLEIANGGTLFLDEIGEMPLAVQPKLLRFLETREYLRTDGKKKLKSDVRLISATNRDLRQEVLEKRFREDLLLHISVVTLDLPLLRNRRDDIPLLVEHFLTEHAGTKEPKHLDEAAIGVLMKYDWPGNIRELENIIERAVVLSRGTIIHAADLAVPLAMSPSS